MIRKCAPTPTVVGDVAFIELTLGNVAELDASDLPLVSGLVWSTTRHDNCVYAANAKTRRLMHRTILGIADPLIHVDHIDGNGLNNRRANLRICSHGENMRNRRPNARARSKYKGVTWESRITSAGNIRTCGWRARIRIGGRCKQVGWFRSEEEAARAYDKAAIELHGEFARLNFPRA